MRKFVAWFIAIALVALLLYAIVFSDLPADVVDPFTPPGNPHP